MIILLGFPKSGTTSFHHLFQEIGLSSIHWRVKFNKRKSSKYIGKVIRDNFQKEINPLSGLKERYDCITQMDYLDNEIGGYFPQVELLSEIYKHNPDDIYILNKRDVKEIVRSMKKWNNMYKRFFECYPERRHENLEDIINNHYDYVRNLLKDANFIEYDINIDTIDKLRRFIDIPDHITHLPIYNQNPNKK